MKKMAPLFTILRTFALLPMIFSVCASHSVAATLQLSDYLNEVKSQSAGVKSSEAQIEGTEKSAKENNLLYIPHLTLQGAFTHDYRQFPNPFQAKTDSPSFGLGFEKQFDFGLSAKLSYNMIGTNYYPPSTFLKDFAGAQTQIDLSQSLWRNFFGKETRATADLAEASSLAAHYGERFKLKQTLAQAETAYFQLAIANESVKLENELLDRSKKILEWTSKRVQNHLTDKIDFLQSKAAYQARLISLQTAEQNQRSSKINFNQFRNQNSDQVADDISLSSTDLILNLKTPARSEETDDIKATKQSERITRATNELSLQKAEPELSLFGTAGFNGIDFNQASTAIKSSFTTQNPIFTLGVKLNFPLYFWETSEIRSGRVKQQLAAELGTQQKTLESETQFKDLALKFTEAQSRLKMADELVTLQKEKLEYEKYRFNLGRTTTYQVLTFEQDYAQALISRLQVENQILAIHAQLKTFSNE